MDYKEHSYEEKTQELVQKAKENGSQYKDNKKPDTEVKTSNDGKGAKNGRAIDLSPDSTDSGKTNSGAKASKEKKKVEFRNLEGDLKVRPYNHTMNVGLASTVRLMGFGKYLSGHYFVKKKQIKISGGSVMELSFSVVKTRFGENLKAYVDDYHEDGVKVTKDDSSKSKVGSTSTNSSGSTYTSADSSSASSDSSYSSSSSSDSSSSDEGEVTYVGGGKFSG